VGERLVLQGVLQGYVQEPWLRAAVWGKAGAVADVVEEVGRKVGQKVWGPAEKAVFGLLDQHLLQEAAG
jgi:hypothetical protein